MFKKLIGVKCFRIGQANAHCQHLRRIPTNRLQFKWAMIFWKPSLNILDPSKALRPISAFWLLHVAAPSRHAKGPAV
jgi:hypothetical protein